MPAAGMGGGCSDNQIDGSTADKMVDEMVASEKNKKDEPMASGAELQKLMASAIEQLRSQF
jgi:hypothetical protein